MTVAAPRVSDSAQALIDHRLDAIDRLLMLNGTPRQDRLNIVSEVEAQIFELLEKCEMEEPGRDDVLAVLAQLDPPEAYVSENPAQRPIPAASRTIPSPDATQSSEEAATARIGKTSGILGLSTLGLLFLAPLLYVAAYVFDSEGLLLVGVFAIDGLLFVGGLLAAVLAIYVRFRGVWAVVGLVTGVLAFLASIGFALFMLATL